MVIGGKAPIRARQGRNVTQLLYCAVSQMRLSVSFKRIDSLSIALRTFCLPACLIVERSAVELKSQTHIVHTIVHLETRKNE